MLIPRKELITVETYRCKLGIHAWVTEHWWELRQRPRNILTRKGGRKRAQYYKKYPIMVGKQLPSVTWI